MSERSFTTELRIPVQVVVGGSTPGQYEAQVFDTYNQTRIAIAQGCDSIDQAIRIGLANATDALGRKAVSA
ncbi:MAG: hypothetical protein JWR63_2004 [Conexibacter sp.]|nr:hypothetical protein [Conexibacter sp.]